MTLRLLLVQGVATAIDALAGGVSFAALHSFSIFSAAALIACVTFALSAAGVLIGKRYGIMLGRKAQILGGLLLIGIGVKIFVTHMFF
jgi:putative Mn2+ efflux pump MntP